MTRHHVAIQMEEEQQWEKDNGPIVKTADQLWKYSGETELDSEDLLDARMKETVRIVLLDNGVYSLLSERRSQILDYWLENQDKTIKELGHELKCSPTTVSKTIRKYLIELKKHKID